MQNPIPTRSVPRRILQGGIAPLLLAGAAFAGGFSTAQADESGAILDALVKKGVLTTSDANDVRAQVAQDSAQSSEGKIKLSNSVTALRLYGDLRLRWQYNDSQTQIDTGNNVSQQSRWRYRLRLNADFDLGPNWFAGIQLQTGQPADSANQTYSNGFNNDSIFISKAFLGWQNDWLKIVAGKQSNPFYTTDLVWDPDINPAGLTEIIQFHKLFGGGSAGPDGKDSKEVAPVTARNPWEVTLVAGQYVFGDNNEFNNTGDLSSDPYIFNEQLIVKYNFNKDTSITVAPAFLSESAAKLTGLTNTLPFTDENAYTNGTTAVTTTTQAVDSVSVTYNAAGVPTRTVTPTTNTITTTTAVSPTTGLRTTTTNTTTLPRTNAVVTTGAATGLANNPALAGQTIASSVTHATPTTTTTNNVTEPGVTGETRALHLITAPGDISFKLGGLKTKLYWDLSYNVSGRDRYDNVYQLEDYGSRAYKSRDGLAWLVGLQFGETKKKGDWQLYVNYRETGIASVDPNLNDSDVAGSALNQRGFKIGLAYQLADAVVVQATGYTFWNLDSTLAGGRATGAGGVAPYNTYNAVQLDFNIKF